MPQNFIARARGQTMSMPPDLTDWVPEDHVVWSILGAVEVVDVRVIHQPLAPQRAEALGEACRSRSAG